MAARVTLSYLAQAYLNAKALADETPLGKALRTGQNCLKSQFKQTCKDGWDEKSAAKDLPASALKKMAEWSNRWGTRNHDACSFTPAFRVTAQQFSSLSNGDAREWSQRDIALVETAKKAHQKFKNAVLKAFDSLTLNQVKARLAEEIEAYPRLGRLVERWHTEM